MRVERSVPSPLGPLRVRVEAGSLRAIEFLDPPQDGAPGPDHSAPPPPQPPGDIDVSVLDAVEAYILAWFRGAPIAAAFPIEPGGTAFQRSVWAEVRRIPWGRTRSYGSLARELSGSARAVGAANGKNPLPLLVPCHRVVGADGGLVGYGGGLARKLWLLRHEGAWLL